MFLDEVNQSVYGLALWDVELHSLFANVKVDLSRRAADVSEVSICHLARTIYDTTHYSDFHAFQVICSSFDLCGDFLKVEQCTSAGRASHIVGLK